MNAEQEAFALRDWPEQAVCKILASKVRKARQDFGESQAEFAARAGIPLRTYKRFELHGKGTLEGFIRVLRTLGRTQYLFMLFPSPLPASLKAREDAREKIRARSGEKGPLDVRSVGVVQDTE
jgi:transcriptional regulator with XRE-family HTH domain